MKRLGSLRLGLVAVIAVLLAACADSHVPLAPTVEEAPQEARVVRPMLSVVEWREVKGSRSATAVIGPEGGALQVGAVRFTVPPGALDRPVRIVMVVPGGRHARVQFAPSGLHFKVPARLSIGLGSAGISAQSASDMVGVYFRGSPVGGQIDPLETFEVTLKNGAAEFDVPHFSGYALAKG